MNPQEFRMTFLAVNLLLALFGIFYNSWIDRTENVPWTKALTAVSVVVGVTVTMLVVGAFFSSPSMWQAIGLLFWGFVSSGTPMIVGHRRRYMKALQEQERAKDEEQQARNGHRKMKWPYEMRNLRDVAAEEVMAALRDLNSLPQSMLMDEQLKVGRARERLAKVLGMLIKAGAHVQIEDV